MKRFFSYIILVSLSASLVACNKKTESVAKATAKVEKVVKAEAKSDSKTKDPLALKVIDWKEDKGIGPIKSDITLKDLDDALAEKGKGIYKEKCTACHKMNKRYIGPGLKGVTTRRRPEWILNMILNPVEMVEKNGAAKKLLQEYSAPMADQSVSEEDAYAILEYFRKKDSKKKKKKKGE